MSNIIDPERRQKVIDGLARGESVRSIALTVGVSKATVDSIRGKLPAKPIEYPTADEVAKIIEAASREAGASMETVLALWGGLSTMPEILRTRAYTALAINRLFPGCPQLAIAAMVGNQRVNGYLGTIQSLMARGKFKWFDPAALDRVAGAIERETKSDGGMEARATAQGHAAQVSGDGEQEMDAPVSAVDGMPDRHQSSSAEVALGPSDIPPSLPVRSPKEIRRWSDSVSRSAAPGKQALYDLLAEAVRNTGGKASD